MKVLILGAGRVGGSLATALVNNNYDVSIVDFDKSSLAALEDKLDILTVEGHASHPLSIKKAGADESTTVIAVTSNDEVNLIACQIAKNSFNVKKTICRLSEETYSENLDIFGTDIVDIVISPEKEVMNHLKELIKHCEVEDVILYGVSFGAAVVAKYAANNPENISFIGYQVPLINSANIPLLSVAKVPLYGDLLTRVLLVPGVLKRIEEYEGLMSKKLLDHYKGQFEVKGTEKFFKKFFLGNATSNRLDDHNIIGSNSIPSYFAYAEDDVEIDSQLVEEAIKKYDNPIVKKYSGGHFFSSGIEKKVAQEFIDSIKK